LVFRGDVKNNGSLLSLGVISFGHFALNKEVKKIKTEVGLNCQVSNVDFKHSGAHAVP